ncbi:MAG: bifunctional demethylmenaquinone methyltransferase/2-methoxy-6-polyprenyl-1,4-benzoquinol methylase UbiE [gamma proteobacterium symbiont of Bathyaustriella thionipta]|nr:bifunctional demethylmenaquinone methyltransferase/2-methoxy-6-polyprenyl-1,4-benzoquinol methylase UbiE [gamma proteobacterium symbiont of Bathyaustriella thionipta]
MSDPESTHFGYQKVAKDDKQNRVKAVFDSVAGRYDVMNDLMSLGIHRLWKRTAIEMSGVRKGHQVLDLAAGTGDLSSRFSTLVGDDGFVLMSDINAAMLQQGRERMLDEGHSGNIAYAQINAEQLPFAENSFDCISIGFGLRNVTDKQCALNAMFAALRPGGRALILEFSKPAPGPFKTLYDTWSFQVLPRLGKLVASDSDSYQYLAESIRMHPDQETLKGMMQEAGFERCDFRNLSNGIVAIHRGFKI